MKKAYLKSSKDELPKKNTWTSFKKGSFIILNDDWGIANAGELAVKTDYGLVILTGNNAGNHSLVFDKSLTARDVNEDKILVFN